VNRLNKQLPELARKPKALDAMEFSCSYWDFPGVRWNWIGELRLMSYSVTNLGHLRTRLMTYIFPFFKWDKRVRKCPKDFLYFAVHEWG